MKTETIGQRVRSGKKLKIRFDKVIIPRRCYGNTKPEFPPGTKGRILKELVTGPGVVS